MRKINSKEELQSGFEKNSTRGYESLGETGDMLSSPVSPISFVQSRL